MRNKSSRPRTKKLKHLRPRKPIVGSFPACCARAASGHATAAPLSSVMNWRRLRSSMGSPPGTRRASLPQTQDAQEAPATGGEGRPVRAERPTKKKPRSRRGLPVWRVQRGIEHVILVRPFYDELRAAQWRSERSLDLLSGPLPSSPPAEKATARQDQAGKKVHPPGYRR